MRASKTGSEHPLIAHFGPFQVDFRSRQLFRDGQRIPIQNHSLQLLLALLEEPGAVVTRDMLRHLLWKENEFVDFELGLNTAMLRLRRVLADTAETPQFIETIPRQGYRFVAPVRFSLEGDEENARHQPTETIFAVNDCDPPESSATRRPPARLPKKVSAMLVLPGALALFLIPAALFLWSSLSTRLAAASPVTVAVLPFDCLSSEPSQQFLAEAVTEQLITELGKSEHLRVISRGTVMQYRDRHVPLEEVARTLHADAVLEGSANQVGERMRITANLYDVATKKHIWAETYDRQIADGFSGQQEIVLDMARNIRFHLKSPEPYGGGN